MRRATAVPHLALSVLLVAVLAASAAAQGDLQKRFEALDDAGDHAGIVALWRDHPFQTIGTIDSYLEGFLALVEKPGEADAAKIEAMKKRALRGARAADEAFGRPIFGDYASSFVGWSPEQQAAFREGQKANGAARGALRKKDFEAARKQALLCIEKARPLGDWWGTASGLSALGQAERGLGRSEAALDALQQSRILFHDLGLAKDAARDAAEMVELLLELDRPVRAAVTVEQGLGLAKACKDAALTARLEDLRTSVQERGGFEGLPGGK